MKTLVFTFAVLTFSFVGSAQVKTTTVDYQNGSKSVTKTHDGVTQNHHISKSGQKSTGVAGTDTHKSFVKDAKKANGGKVKKQRTHTNPAAKSIDLDN